MVFICFHYYFLIALVICNWPKAIKNWPVMYFTCPQGDIPISTIKSCTLNRTIGQCNLGSTVGVPLHATNLKWIIMKINHLTARTSSGISFSLLQESCLGSLLIQFQHHKENWVIQVLYIFDRVKYNITYQSWAFFVFGQLPIISWNLRVKEPLLFQGIPLYSS